MTIPIDNVPAEIKNIPIYWHKNKSKKILLNMNSYRNLNFHVSNKIKKAVHKWVVNNISSLPVLKPPLKFEYTIYRKTKRKTDLGNIGAVVDKFIADALVNIGFIEDDNTDIIKKIVFIDGGVLPDNPHCDLVITEIDTVYDSLFAQCVKDEIKEFGFSLLCEDDGIPVNVPLSPKVKHSVVMAIHKFKD